MTRDPLAPFRALLHPTEQEFEIVLLEDAVLLSLELLDQLFEDFPDNGAESA